MAITPKWVDGFGHRRIAAPSPYVGTAFGSPTIVTTPVRGNSGTSLEISAANEYVEYAVTAGRFWSASFYLRFSSLPGADKAIIGTLGGASFRLDYDVTTGKLQVTAHATANTGGPVIVAGTWYRVTLEFDSSADPRVARCQVDDTTEFSASQSLAPADITRVTLGDINSSGSGTYYVNSLVISETNGDYETMRDLVSHDVETLRPTADGTHNVVSNTAFQDDGAAHFTNASTNVWTHLDESPMEAGNSGPNEWVSQDENQTAAYLEVLLGNLVAGSLTVEAVRTYLTYDESSDAGISNSEARLLLSDDTEVLTTGSLSVKDSTDDPGSTDSLFSRMAIAPAGGWDRTKVDGLKARLGFADGTPIAYFVDLAVEVLLVEPAGPSGSGTLSLGAIQAAGVGDFDAYASGTASIAALLASGAGDVPVDGSGLAALGALVAAGSGHREFPVPEHIVEIAFPFDPGGIPDPLAWLRADAIEGVADASTVATWDDVSGNNHDAAQATEASKPTYQIDELNGLPAVRFDGANDWMETGAFSAELANATVFVVARMSGVGSTAQAIVDGLISGKRNAILNAATGDWAIQSGGSDVVDGDSDADWHVLAATFRGAASDTLHVDSVLNATGDSGGDPLSGLTIGSAHDQAQPFAGDVAEVLVYDGALSDADRKTVEAYLAIKYGFEFVWTDVTSYVKDDGFHTNRGAQHEFDRMQMGQGDLTLQNIGREFEPEYAGSPFYPYVLPMRLIRIRALWRGVVYGVLYGFIDEWPLRYPDAVSTAVVPITIVDGFEPLALARVSGSFVEEASGARVNAVLDAAGWPTYTRDVDPGESQIGAATLDDDAALDHLLAVAESELGLFFVTKDGLVRFVDRFSVFTAPEDPDNLTWGDVPGENRYVDVVPEYGASQIRNQAKITREGGVEQVATDEASARRYGAGPGAYRTFTRTVLLATDNAVADYAAYILLRLAEPGVRFASMELATLRDKEQWEWVLGLELGDRITVRRRPPGGGDPIERTVYVQGIEHNRAGDMWDVRLRLAPIAGLDFWELGVDELGVGTRLAI